MTKKIDEWRNDQTDIENHGAYIDTCEALRMCQERQNELRNEEEDSEECESELEYSDIDIFTFVFGGTVTGYNSNEMVIDGYHYVNGGANTFSDWPEPFDDLLTALTVDITNIDYLSEKFKKKLLAQLNEEIDDIEAEHIRLFNEYKDEQSEE